jgi:hypothetical protein
VICPNCREEAAFNCKLNFHIDLFACPKKCLEIIRDDDNIYHYELEQTIDDATYYMEVYDMGVKSSTVISLITFDNVVESYPPSPTPRYYNTILTLNYPWIFKSQEELNNIVTRLLKLKAFT